MPLDEGAGRAPAFIAETWLALDLGGYIGWAIGPTPKDLEFGTEKLPHVGGQGMRGSAFDDWLSDFLRDHRPTKLLLEAPLPPQAQTASWSAQQQYGLHWSSLLQAYRWSAGVYQQDARSIRDEVMGTRRLKSRDGVKDDVLRYVRQRGYKVKTHHAADAVLLWLAHWQRVRGIAPAAGPLWSGFVP